jgi:hypothetical protein
VKLSACGSRRAFPASPSHRASPMMII